MNKTNTSEAIIHFPLKDGEEVVEGGIYEIVDGKAQAIGEEITGSLLGVCIGGGDKLEKGHILLDIDPTSIYEEPYEEAPTIGDYVDTVKLVISVNTDAETFRYLLRANPS